MIFYGILSAFKTKKYGFCGKKEGKWKDVWKKLARRRKKMRENEGKQNKEKWSVWSYVQRAERKRKEDTKAQHEKTKNRKNAKKYCSRLVKKRGGNGLFYKPFPPRLPQILFFSIYIFFAKSLLHKEIPFGVFLINTYQSVFFRSHSQLFGVVNLVFAAEGVLL